MKACLLKAAAPITTHPLVYTDVEQPTCLPDQVLIKVNVCGICRTDLHVVEGDLPLPKLPIIPGHQIVGTVAECGRETHAFKKGQRVGVAWLQSTCGTCVYCRKSQENLCERAKFTGWTAQGGYAEYAVAPENYIYPLPDAFSDAQAAPLLCAGIIGYRSIRLTGIQYWPGARVGIYGFGAAGHVAIQLMQAWGADVYVATRDKKHQELAESLGAVWTGGTLAKPPVPLDAAIVFAPVGEIVPVALKALDKAGVLVLAGIHMSPIPSFDYKILYGERVIRSVTNNTRQDGEEFLQEATRLGIKTHVVGFPLSLANEALEALKHDGFQGAGLLY
ncbi:MAG: zinc-dependent alcohol dehydrogenase family protein [Pseudomonadota bacterium]